MEMYYFLGYPNMSTPKMDDIEAVRTIFDTIKDFNSEDQQRILRWVAEKIKLPQPFAAPGQAAAHNPLLPSGSILPGIPHPGASGLASGRDIKTFIDEKKPRNDVQFAAAVAYYYRFESPQSERKETINKEDLQEAARKAKRERFTNPLQTLNNAHNLGLLDRGSEKATFCINSVGENLVAMTLPDGAAPAKASKKKTGRATAKKAAAKKAQPQKAAKKQVKRA
jgi:hypothetical protein